MALFSKYRLTLRVFGGAFAATLLLAFLLVASLPFVGSLFSTSQFEQQPSSTCAYASEMAESNGMTTKYGLPITTMSQVRATTNVSSLFTHPGTINRGDVYLIVATGISWEDISESRTQALYELAEESATANVVNGDVVNWETHLDIEKLHLIVFDEIPASDLDEFLQRFLPTLKVSDSLILTNSQTFLGENPSEEYVDQYSLFIMRDTSDEGLLTSTTTRTRGLITSGDAVLALDALIINPQRYPANLEIDALSSLIPASNRITSLAHEAAAATSLQASQPTFTVIFVVCLLIAISVSIALIFLEMHIRPKIMSYLLPASRILWIFTLAIPLASYLVVLQLPTYPDAEICLDYFGFVVMEISLVCIIVSLVFRWTISYFLILAATVITLILDQLLGGTLSCGTYLSYAPLENVRFYGIGNEGAALLFGSWVMLVAFYLTRRPFSNLARMLREWLYPVLTLVVIVIIAAPWWGANFGIIIWGLVGGYISWRRFNEHRLRIREIIGVVLAAGVCAICVLLMDTTFNGDSHMGGQIDFSQGDIFGRIAQIFSNVAALFVDTITYSPVLALLFAIIVVFLGVLIVKQPGGYKEFLSKHSEFHGAFSGLLASAILMLAVEDSGILMPALLLLYPLSGFIWLLCNYHSWHIRSFLRAHNVLER